MSSYRGHHRQRSLRGPLVGVLVVLAALGLAVPAASGGFTARVTNAGNTATSATYFTCGSAVTGTPKAYFAYAFGESGGLTAADASGNNRPGSYSSLLNAPTGVTFGQQNTGSGAVCPRDRQTTIRLDGLTGAVAGPTASMVGPTTFSVEIWFRTSSPQGKLIGFGDQRTGLSANYDRHLYIDANGRLVFGVFPGTVRTLSTPNAVTDNAWHQAVGTLSSAGMMLYLDGKLVASDTGTTTAQAFTGYWRIGYDNLAFWPNAPLSSYVSGSLAFAAVYTDALTAAQVAAHYVAGT